MFGIGGTEFLVIILVVLIVFGPGELPKAMRSAGAAMRTLNRVGSEYRRQFEQALREAEREMEIEEMRESIEGSSRDSPAAAGPMQPQKQGAGSIGAPEHPSGNAAQPTSHDSARD